MIDTDEARALALAEARPDWPAEAGTLRATVTHEDADDYLVTVGVEESDTDYPARAMVDDSAYLINKDTGKVRLFSFVFNLDKAESMRRL